MRSIDNWQQLIDTEQDSLSKLITPADFDLLAPSARDSLINIYYLMISNKVAGNLWPHLTELRWLGINQLGVYVVEPEKLLAILSDSSNFRADGRLTCYIKKSFWSLRQWQIDGQPISHYGLQLYHPQDPKQPKLIVIDIDTVVFSSWLSWPRHAWDILRPDPSLNDPLRVRSTLQARGIFPMA